MAKPTASTASLTVPPDPANTKDQKMAVQTEFGDIIEKLAVHEATLTSELDEVATQAKQLGERLAQIQSALAALRDTEPNAKSKRGGDTAKKKKGATPTIVQELAIIVLGKNECLPFEQLLAGVKSEMLARGLSRVGAKSSLADAITKPAFTINPDHTVSVK
jgi:hypothetical protein